MVSTLSVPAPAVPARSAPTRLRVPDLLCAVDRAADDVLSGRYEHLLPTDGPPSDDRWFTRIHGDDELDIWLISWVKDHSTELHDHGGSLGALTLVSGALDEFRWDGEAIAPPPAQRRGPGRLSVGVGTRRRVGAHHRPRHTDAQCARLLSAAYRDVVLRRHPPEHSAPQPDRTDR